MKGTRDNLPFGEDGGVIGESEKHRFTNYERDAETLSDYAVNRQFSQTTGRFTRPDPVGGNISSPQSLNRYAHVLGDPVNLADPFGLVVWYCPPQFSSCGEVEIVINGIRFTVGVGFSGGFATFLWDQLPLMEQGQIARLFKESPLPQGFDIYPKSFLALVTEREPSITGQSRSKTTANIQKDIDDCERAGAGALSGSPDSAERFVKFLGRKAATTLLLEAAKAGGRAAAASGAISDATASGRLVAWGSKLPPVGPAGVALLFLQLSYVSAPTEEQLESERQFQTIKKKCAKAVAKKYGLR